MKKLSILLLSVIQLTYGAEQSTAPQLVEKIKCTTGSVNSLSWNQDGIRVVTGGGLVGPPPKRHLTAQTILPYCESLVALYVINSVTGKHLKQIKGHQNTVRSVEWHRDGQRIVSGSSDKLIRVLDHDSKRCLQKFKGSNTIWSVRCNKDGRRIASEEIGTVNIWDLEANKALRRLKGGTACAIDWHPDNERIAVGSPNQSIFIWDTRTKDSIQTINNACSPHNNPAALRWNQDGVHLASSCYDGIVRLWDIRNNQCTQRFATDRRVLPASVALNLVRSLDWHPDGRRLAAGCDNKSAYVLDIFNNRCIQKLRDPGCIYSTRWSPDGQRLAIGSSDGTVHIWEYPEGEDPDQDEGSDSDDGEADDEDNNDEEFQRAEELADELCLQLVKSQSQSQTEPEQKDDSRPKISPRIYRYAYSMASPLRTSAVMLKRPISTSSAKTDSSKKSILAVATSGRVTTFENNQGQLSERDCLRAAGQSLSYHPSGEQFAVSQQQGENMGTITIFLTDDHGRLTQEPSFSSDGKKPQSLKYHPSGQTLAVANWESKFTKEEEDKISPKVQNRNYMDGLTNAIAKAINGLAQKTLVPSNGDVTTFTSRGGKFTKTNRFTLGNMIAHLGHKLRVRPSDIAYHPSGRFLAAACLQGYGPQRSIPKDSIDQNLLGDIVVLEEDNPGELQVIGRYFTINKPTSGRPAAVAIALTYDPSGQVLAAISKSLDKVVTFTSNDNGQLTRIGPFDTQGKDAFALTYHPSGARLAVANKRTNDVTTFLHNKGILNFIGKFPSNGDRPCALSYTSSGDILAVANNKSRTITTFLDNQGQLIPIGTFATKGNPRALAFRPEEPETEDRDS